MQAKKFGIIGIIVLMSIGLVAVGASSINQLACEGQPINFRLEPTAEQQIWGERVIGQSFVAPRDGLNRIDILFQTYQRQNTHDVFITLFEITNAENLEQRQLIKEFSLNTASVQDRSWRTFNFAPIPDSANKSYLITIQSPDSVPGDAITVGGIEWNVYEPGVAFLGPVPARADIAFRACFQISTQEKLQVLVEQITQNRPGVWGSATFYGISLLFYAVLVVALFLQLAKMV